MTPRLTSRMTVDALFRRVRSQGGFATVLARGDDGAGTIMVLCMERGDVKKLLERRTDLEGNSHWAPSGPQDVEDQAIRDLYIQRRRDSDPDLWLIELDIADAERFAAEMT